MVTFCGACNTPAPRSVRVFTSHRSEPQNPSAMGTASIIEEAGASAASRPRASEHRADGVRRDGQLLGANFGVRMHEISVTVD